MALIIPKDIEDKINLRNQLLDEIVDWFKSVESDISDFDLEHLKVVEEVTGTEQNGGEYCDQRCLDEDYFVGTYYWPTASKKYVACEYETL